MTVDPTVTFILAAVLFGAAIVSFIRKIRVRRWPSIDAIVTSCARKKVVGGLPFARGDVIWSVTISYSVFGQTHTRTIGSPHPVDRSIAVFYNPANPSEFATTRTSLWEPAAWAVIALSMLVAGLNGGYDPR
jgi:hypothetical protein